MTSELAKQHTKFDALMRELEEDLATLQPGISLTGDAKAYFAEMDRRHAFIEARLRERLVDVFRDDLEIKAPGPLAASTAKALVGVVSRMMNDKTLTSEIPFSTATKVEM